MYAVQNQAFYLLKNIFFFFFRFRSKTKRSMASVEKSTVPDPQRRTST